MVYRLIEVVTVFVHFGFVLYVVLGGFVAWKWRRTIGFHLLAVVWGAGSIAVGYDCPLTNLENWARRMAGIAELPSTGFISHYITGVFYPASIEGLVQALAATVVVGSWVGYVLLGRHSKAEVKASSAT
ncbi:membrane protein [Rhodococcus erythropolis]|nr:membrane protein [Rhodococcus erythropolis]